MRAQVDVWDTLQKDVQYLASLQAMTKAVVPNPERPVEFREEECGGAFDGFRVTSDADPGL